MIAETLDPRALRTGLLWAVAGGAMVAVYTVYDAWGIRQAPNPFTFLAWFFFLTAFDMPLIALWRYRRAAAPPALGPLSWRGFVGAILAWFSFGSAILATRLDKIGEAAVLRETSTVFAALIGWLFLGEKVGPHRTFLMVLIATGAVLVELGS